MRRLLRLDPDGPPQGIFGASGAFNGSIAVSAARCLVTYVVIPVAGPALGLSGAVGPVLGLLLAVVSALAIGYSVRRFFAADHRYRWAYAGVGGAVLVLVAVQAVIDLVALAG